MGVLSVFNSSIVRGVRSYFPAQRDNAEPKRRPETQEEHIEHYDKREAAYLGLAYRLDEIRKLRLFRALDPTGQVVAVTRRMTRDVQHVVETDAHALVGHELRLVAKAGEGEDDDPVEQGRDIWLRSSVAGQLGKWARISAALGDIHWEAVRLSGTAPFDVHLVGYDPRFVQLEYDTATQTIIEKATIRIEFNELDGDGNVRRKRYERVLTPTDITVSIDGVVQDDQSGPHKLGVTPLVHVPFIPWTDPAHGLWAAHGLDAPLSMVDSLLTQMLAIGNRYASPLWVAMGFRLKQGVDLNFGRVIAIPDKGRFEALEPTLTAVDTLIKAAETARALARETLPEFLFTDAGASASGSALNFRATSFVAKMEEIRGRWYDGLIRVTEYGMALEDDRAYDPALVVLDIDAPPVLPVDKAGQVTIITSVMKEGGLLRKDYIAHLQRLDIVPTDVTPSEYAVEVAEEQAALANIEANALAGVVASMNGEPVLDEAVDTTSTTIAGDVLPEGELALVEPPPSPAPLVDGEPTTAEALAVASEAGETDPASVADTAAVQQVALNGAQVSAMLEIIGRVVEGQLPRDSGVELMVVAFGISADVAESLMGDVGRSFVPTEEEPAAPAE